VLEIIIKRECC